jgi:hypothetical protein
MSNHCGSYLINAMLHLLDDYQVYESLGKEKTLAFMEKIRNISFDNDCNDGEILENIGEKLGICYGCWDYKDDLEYGVCKECY